MLDLINRLRNSEVQRDIDLPMIPVIGNQSVGKLSIHLSSNQFLESPFLVHRAVAQGIYAILVWWQLVTVPGDVPRNARLRKQTRHGL
ncbi:hypothetical protein BKA82DRAFT_4221674, partial [Pisolithus tinctorius]